MGNEVIFYFLTFELYFNCFLLHSNGKKQDIALKELIMGIEDFGVEVLDEFLVEIKFMSALKNDYIVQFLGISLPPDNSKLYLVTVRVFYNNLPVFC